MIMCDASMKDIYFKEGNFGTEECPLFKLVIDRQLLPKYLEWFHSNNNTDEVEIFLKANRLSKESFGRLRCLCEGLEDMDIPGRYERPFEEAYSKFWNMHYGVCELEMFKKELLRLIKHYYG
jgi:hypothetical protein